MHPVSAHTAPNAKRTGNVNLDAARHGTVRPATDRHGICLLDGAWQGIFLLDTLCQRIFLLDAAVSGHFPSGRSRVWAFSFWTQPCQGIFLLDASGRHVSWQHGHAGCQGAERRSKYLGRIRKHAAGSRHSDSVQFYSLYLRYVHLYMLLHTSRFPQKHPASHPLPRSSHAVMLF